MTDAIAELAGAVGAVLDRGLSEEESIAAMRPAMDRLLARADELPADASQPDAEGGAIALVVGMIDLAVEQLDADRDT